MSRSDHVELVVVAAGNHGYRLKVHDEVVAEVQHLLVGLLGLLLGGVAQNEQRRHKHVLSLEIGLTPSLKMTLPQRTERAPSVIAR